MARKSHLHEANVRPSVQCHPPDAVSIVYATQPQARHPQASQPPIGFENLCALVVPAPSPMTAPEMSPEDRKRQLTMREVSALMWCEEDDDHGNDDMGARGGTPQVQDVKKTFGRAGSGARYLGRDV